jgi:hypothetical protein
VLTPTSTTRARLNRPSRYSLGCSGPRIRCWRQDRSYHQFVGTATIFSHDDVEDRRALYDDSLECADFLNGSEVLTKFPPDWERIYLQRE